MTTGAAYETTGGMELIDTAVLPGLQYRYTVVPVDRAGNFGGLFHNHTLGLYQVDQVAATPGIHMQNFTRDPNRPTIEQMLCEDPAARERIVKASLRTPILISGMSLENLRSVLPIVRDGRFMLNVNCEKDDDPIEILNRIRRASTLVE